MDRSIRLGQLGLLLCAGLVCSTGCPNQELAPLAPCTVSGVSLDVPQTGVDKVDLLFMIDNSGSMAEEQAKLAQVLPDLVAVLTTGQYDPIAVQEKPDFPPVKSLHIGVVSSDMGVAGLPPGPENARLHPPSCGIDSYDLTAPDPHGNNPASPINRDRFDRPLGDNGLLKISTAVAVAGISARPQDSDSRTTPVSLVVPGDQACANLELSENQRFIDFTFDSSNPAMNQQNAARAAQQFGCVAKLGKNGCGLEQQLEAMLKAVTPANPTPPAIPVVFTENTRGHADVANRNFLREEAILAVVLVTDEEDCSIPDSSNALFAFGSRGLEPPEDLNIRCFLPKYQDQLHPVSRYIDGLRALKPTYPDRIIFAGIVGIPLSPRQTTFSGEAELQAILDSAPMQFAPQPGRLQGTFVPAPTCTSPRGDGTAAPGRRMVEVAQAFGENGVVTSICEDEYGDALDVIIRKIAAQLTGACLPRRLARENGRVECDVVEVLPDLRPCDPARGHIETLPTRIVLKTERRVCRIDQVAVGPGNVLEAGKTGWYYDDFSEVVRDECEDTPQRISFTDQAKPYEGSQVRFECFQPVSSADEDSTGLDAVNLACTDDNVCAQKDQRLYCINNACQIGCDNDAQCPLGWLCVLEEGAVGYCVNPTCPPSQTTE